MSQEKLAELADITRNYVGILEKGDKAPTLTTLLRIAQCFDLKPSQLLAEAGL